MDKVRERRQGYEEGGGRKQMREKIKREEKREREREG